MKAEYQRDMCFPVHCTIIRNRQDKETTQASMIGWMDKDVVYVYIIFAHEKERNLAICDSIDGT